MILKLNSVTLVFCLLSTNVAFSADPRKPNDTAPKPVTGWLYGDKGSMYLTKVESYSVEEVESSRWAETDYERGGRRISVQVKFVALIMPRGCNTSFAQRTIVGHYGGEYYSKPARFVIQFSDLKHSKDIGTMSVCPGVDPLRISFNLPLATKIIIDGGKENLYVSNERMLLDFPGENESVLKLEVMYSKTDGTLTVREILRGQK